MPPLEIHRTAAEKQSVAIEAGAGWQGLTDTPTYHNLKVLLTVLVNACDDGVHRRVTIKGVRCQQGERHWSSANRKLLKHHAGYTQVAAAQIDRCKRPNLPRAEQTTAGLWTTNCR